MLRLLTPTLCSLVLACASASGPHLVRFRDRAQPRPVEACEPAPLISPSEMSAKHCVPFAEVTLGGPAWSPPCDMPALERFLPRYACKQGASHARIVRRVTPLGDDACHTLRALLLTCIGE